MKAILSGQAGVGILVNRDSLSLVRVGVPDTLPCRDEDVLWLLADASDISEMEVDDDRGAVHELNIAWVSDRAVQEAFILIDKTEPEGIRCRAAALLATNVEQPRIADFVNNTLYALPRIEDADFDGALRCVPDKSSKVRDLLVEVQRNQESIQLCRKEWDALPARLFVAKNGSRGERHSDFANEKRAVERAMTAGGGFRRFARATSRGVRADNDVEFLQSLTSKELARFTDVLGEVIERWATAVEPTQRAMVRVQVLGRPALLKLSNCARLLVNSLGEKAGGRGPTDLLREAAEIAERRGFKNDRDLQENIGAGMRDVAYRWLSESQREQATSALVSIWEAVDRLPPADLERLRNFAKLRVRELGRKAHGREAHDLLSEAITATAEGQRTWRQGIDLRQHLYGVIRSISSSWHERIEQEYLESDLVQPGGASPLEQAATVLDPERILRAKERLEQIRKLFARDDQAKKMVELLGLGCSAREIQEQLRIGPKKFNAVAKRIRRRLATEDHI
jgi:hypothetical protein